MIVIIVAVTLLWLLMLVEVLNMKLYEAIAVMVFAYSAGALVNYLLILGN
jgi:hypothetical protein